MAYFPDLSPYQYGLPEGPNVLNIGWLGGTHPFPQGDVPATFVDRLWQFCWVGIHMMRGFHLCELCDQPAEPTGPLIVRRDNFTAPLGFAEMRVFGVDTDRVYAAPNLLYHYVTAHRYCPRPRNLSTGCCTARCPARPIISGAPARLRGTKTSNTGGKFSGRCLISRHGPNIPAR